MELRHLRYFLCVAEEENIHRASKRLNISQPPLSMAIKQLEEDIGTLLFSREGRGIKLTRAGEVFLKDARNILNDTSNAKHTAFNIGNGIEGTLKIGFVSSAVTGILQRSVTKFKKTYPNIVVDLNQSKNSLISAQLMSKDIDIGILRLPENLPKGVSICYQEPEGWCAALQNNHPLARRKSVEFEDFNQQNIVFYPRENSPTGYDGMMNALKSRNIEINSIQEATEQMTIVGLVVAGAGIGIVPACMSQITMEGIVHIPIKNTEKSTSLAIVIRDKEDLIIDNYVSLL